MTHKHCQMRGHTHTHEAPQESGRIYSPVALFAHTHDLDAEVVLDALDLGCAWGGRAWEMCRIGQGFYLLSGMPRKGGIVNTGQEKGPHTALGNHAFVRGASGNKSCTSLGFLARKLHATSSLSSPSKHPARRKRRLPAGGHRSTCTHT
eukprot:1152832-Pelagomonas_calceolata.AAC.4